jgi:hypothetical protein
VTRDVAVMAAFVALVGALVRHCARRAQRSSDRSLARVGSANRKRRRR